MYVYPILNSPLSENHIAEIVVQSSSLLKTEYDVGRKVNALLGGSDAIERVEKLHNVKRRY